MAAPTELSIIGSIGGSGEHGKATENYNCLAAVTLINKVVSAETARHTSLMKSYKSSDLQLARNPPSTPGGVVQVMW
jgi:hypothetical protein